MKDQGRSGLCEGGGNWNCLKYLKRGWNKKEGRGVGKQILTGGCKLGQGIGVLKKGTGTPLWTMALRPQCVIVTKVLLIILKLFSIAFYNFKIKFQEKLCCCRFQFWDLATLPWNSVDQLCSCHAIKILSNVLGSYCLNKALLFLILANFC